MYFQEATDIDEYLSTGRFGGDLDATIIADYRIKCRTIFPHALLFKDPAPSETIESPPAEDFTEDDQI